MLSEMLLCELSPGNRAAVVRICKDGAMKRRLIDLGFTPGTEVMCVGRSPLSDPAAYLVRGKRIAVRDRDAADIIVEVGNGKGRDTGAFYRKPERRKKHSL